MITGLTHDQNGIINQSVQYQGKISAGFAPNEGPNKTNHPISCGYFRVLKEVTVNDRVGGQDISRKEWHLNEVVQKNLEDNLGGTKTPRKIDFLCLFAEPSQMWSSFLGMYSSTQGILCKGYGMNTVAKEAKTDNDGEKVWCDRKCMYKECPDFKADRCKEIGIMKIFPLIDISTNPYRFETRSVISIARIEAQLDKFWNLCKASHMIRKIEAKKEIPFEGLFGMKFSLIHKKSKSGGKNFYITDLVPTPESIAAIMGPIQRGIAMNQTAALTAGTQSLSLLNANVDEVLLLDQPDDPGVQMNLEDEKAIAVQFDHDADKTPVDNSAMKKAAETLLNQ